MAITINQDEMARLLGRPLSSAEAADFDSLMTTAVSQLVDLLGNKLDRVNAERVYYGRPGYRQIFTDPFTKIVSARVNGIPVEATPMLFDDVNANWFNSVLLEHSSHSRAELTLAAEYGFEDLPYDLKKLLASIFGLSSQPADDNPRGAITSESILSHSVSFKVASDDPWQRLINANQSVINRYRRPNYDVRGYGYEI